MNRTNIVSLLDPVKPLDLKKLLAMITLIAIPLSNVLWLYSTPLLTFIALRTGGLSGTLTGFIVGGLLGFTRRFLELPMGVNILLAL